MKLKSSLAFVLLLGVAACGGKSSAPVAAAPSGSEPIRGLYYNLSYASAVSALGELDQVIPAQLDDTMRNLNIFGFTRIHLWMNDQPPGSPDLIPCGPFSSTTLDTSTYPVTQRTQWPANLLRAFIRRLQSERKTVVLTISPYVPTDAYIDSLAASDGPLRIAREFPGVEIELDMETNWTEAGLPVQCGPLLDLSTAKRRLLKKIRDTVPNVRIGVSATYHHFDDHRELIRGADWFVPQMYGNAADGAHDSAMLRTRFEGLKAELRALGGGAKQVFVGLGVDGSLREDSAGGTVFHRSMQFVQEQRAPGFVLWSRRSIAREPGAASYLGCYLGRTLPATDRCPR